jgi:hypothetical protein
MVWHSHCIKDLSLRRPCYRQRSRQSHPALVSLVIHVTISCILKRTEGHSMVLDPISHTLFIFAGQRDKKYLSDMYAYDISSNTLTELFSNSSASGGPDPCFTQRAIIDSRLKEIYVYVTHFFFFFVVEYSI